MKLLSLSANKTSFHPITFKNGVNIIVGRQVAPHSQNDGNTYNGVGKSLVIHLIHFCLGSNAIETFSTKLPDWEFTLRYEVRNEEYIATRSTNSQNKIILNDKEITLNNYRKKLLQVVFDLTEPPKNMTMNTLFSRFARRYRSCYTKYDTFTPKESDYSKLLNNSYLLNLDTDLIIQKKELREKQTAAKDTEKAIKKDPIFRQYYLGKNDAEIDEADLQYRIQQLEKEISEFKISSNYHELEAEANEKSYKKKDLENKRVLITDYIKNIEVAFQETAEVKQEKVLKIYEEAQIEIPDMVKKNIENVLQFHKEMINSRNTRLRKELAKHKQELMSIDEEIVLLGQRMDELLDYLNSYGALEEYTALTKQLSGLKNELNRIAEYQRILKTYRDLELDIKQKFIEQDRDAEAYIETDTEHITKLRNLFWSNSKRFYPKKKSGFTLKNNSGQNMLRFSMDARIEDDSSDGVNEVRMFCFDLMILLCKKSSMRCMLHDSRLFANMDPRQRETLFRIVTEVCSNNEFQYICTINEDALQSFETLMSKEEYQELILDNVRLELNDDAPESKLLGLQVDMDLEDKEKATGDMN